jgi:hypothetical protein
VESPQGCGLPDVSVPSVQSPSAVKLSHWEYSGRGTWDGKSCDSRPEGQAQPQNPGAEHLANRTIIGVICANSGGCRNGRVVCSGISAKGRLMR